MPRKRMWRPSEVKYLIENYSTKTTDELCAELNRDRKSVNRKIEQLREEGQIGYREDKTIQRAYRQRGSKRRTKSSGSRLTPYSNVDEVGDEEQE